MLLFFRNLHSNTGETLRKGIYLSIVSDHKQQLQENYLISVYVFPFLRRREILVDIEASFTEAILNILLLKTGKSYFLFIITF